MQQLTQRPLSAVREASPFETPPRVLVMAEDCDAGRAVDLVEALESMGADAELRFVTDATRTYRDHIHPDAVIVAGTRGYRVARHHPVLEGISRFSE